MTNRVPHVNGHEVVYADHRYVCLRCGAKMLNMMNFNVSECRYKRTVTEEKPQPSQRELWDAATRHIPEADWDVHVWPHSPDQHYLAGSLDIADRRRLALRIIEEYEHQREKMLKPNDAEDFG